MNVSLSELWELVMDRAAWRAAIHRVAKSRTRLNDWTALNWLTPIYFPGRRREGARCRVQGLGGGANGQGEEDLHCHRVVPRSHGEVVLLKHLSVKLLWLLWGLCPCSQRGVSGAWLAFFLSSAFFTFFGPRKGEAAESQQNSISWKIICGEVRGQDLGKDSQDEMLARLARSLSQLSTEWRFMGHKSGPVLVLVMVIT